MTLVDVLELFAVAVLVPASGLLAIADTVLTQVTRARADALAEEGNTVAARIRELLERREEVLQPVLLLELVCDVVASGLLALVAYRFAGWPGVGIAFLVGFPLIFVVAVALPRTWASRNLDRAMALAAPTIRWTLRLFPIRFLAGLSLGLARRLAPGEPRDPQGSHADESFVAVAGSPLEADEITPEGHALLSSVIEFGKVLVREIMIPRPDMVTLSAATPLSLAVETVQEEGYSRFPVVGRSTDDIVGVVYAKDIVKAALRGQHDLLVSDLAHEAHVVPETKVAAELLREMQQAKLHLAVVVDEYGGTAGLVTMEDIIEELVGEIADEFDDDLPAIERLPGGAARILGALSIDEANEALGIELPEGDWETVAGLVFDHFGGVPQVGEVATVGGHRLAVDRVVGRRIVSLVLEAATAEPAGGDDRTNGDGSTRRRTEARSGRTTP